MTNAVSDRGGPGRGSQPAGLCDVDVEQAVHRQNAAARPDRGGDRPPAGRKRHGPPAPREGPAGAGGGGGGAGRGGGGGAAPGRRLRTRHGAVVPRSSTVVLASGRRGR